MKLRYEVAEIFHTLTLGSLHAAKLAVQFLPSYRIRRRILHSIIDRVSLKRARLVEVEQKMGRISEESAQDRLKAIQYGMAINYVTRLNGGMWIDYTAQQVIIYLQ